MRGVRVLLAPDAFAGALTAVQAADAMAAGWARRAPHDLLVPCPMSNGGPGFVDVVLAARGGALVPVTVGGPRGERVPATLLLVDDDRGRTAYVEAAQACGLHLVPEPERDPTTATSAGVGQLLREAVDAGADRVVLATGGAASHDGGAGLLAALGAGDHPLLRAGGGGLADLPDDALAGLADVRAGLAGVQLVLASDTDLPLVGFSGASATEAEGRGATAEQAQRLEAALGRLADVAQRSLVAGRPLTGRGQAGAAGAGAGGGLGFALLLLGAVRIPAVDVVLDVVRLADQAAAADLVLTGEAVFGWASLRDQVVPRVAATALDAGVPTVVVAGEVEVGRREALAIGVSAAYPVAERPEQLARVRSDPAGALADRVARVARTWSR
jgi:glycerate 2-kinase